MFEKKAEDDSYKTQSNEMIRNAEQNMFDILTVRGDNLSHNLPDVLPIDVKLQQLSTLAESPINSKILYKINKFISII